MLQTANAIRTLNLVAGSSVHEASTGKITSFPTDACGGNDKAKAPRRSGPDHPKARGSGIPVCTGPSRRARVDPVTLESHPAAFTTTRWSLVQAAGGRGGLEAEQALEALCRVYWPPIYVFARRSGHGTEEAKDLTQGFFARLIAKQELAAADQERGRFRTFLITAFRHFVANEHAKATALKRGGGFDPIPLDFGSDAGEPHFFEPSDSQTPERAFDQRWAAGILTRVLARLREEFVLAGRESLFDHFKEFLLGDPPEGGYLATSARLGMTPGAAKMIVSRMRDRYRHLLRNEIAQTVTTITEVEAELRDLRAILRGS